MKVYSYAVKNLHCRLIHITWFVAHLQFPGWLFGAISRNLWINQDIFDISMLEKLLLRKFEYTTEPYVL